MTGKQRRRANLAHCNNSTADAYWKAERLGTLPQAYTDYMAKLFSSQSNQPPHIRELSCILKFSSAQNSAAFQILLEGVGIKLCLVFKLSWAMIEMSIKKHWLATWNRHDSLPLLQPWHCKMYLLALWHSLICGCILGSDFLLITGFFHCFQKYERWMTNDLPNKQYSKTKLRIKEINHPVIILTTTTCKYVPWWRKNQYTQQFPRFAY